jgi:hypothetical protein
VPVPVPMDGGLTDYVSIDDMATHVWVEGEDPDRTCINLARFRCHTTDGAGTGRYYLFFAPQDSLHLSCTVNQCVNMLASLAVSKETAWSHIQGNVLVLKTDLSGMVMDVVLKDWASVIAFVLK